MDDVVDDFFAFRQGIEAMIRLMKLMMQMVMKIMMKIVMKNEDSHLMQVMKATMRRMKRTPPKIPIRLMLRP